MRCTWSGATPPRTISLCSRGTLRTRFDAEVDIDARGERIDAEAGLIATPGLTSATREDVRTLAMDLRRYVERAKAMAGVGLQMHAPSRDGTGTRGETSHRERRAPERPRTREEQEESGQREHHVVLDLGPSEGQEDAHMLRAGDLEDERLRREDAATPLVDVVLRHPGYSSRKLPQVLSILLSIEYSKALALSEGAPCVIAWGIGRERAQRFKTVIEGAGGRVLLAEPGAFENPM